MSDPDTRSRSAWDVPECPECAGRVFVQKRTGVVGEVWYCNSCAVEFAADADRTEVSDDE